MNGGGGGGTGVSITAFLKAYLFLLGSLPFLVEL